MYSSHQSINDDDVYLTPQSNIDEAMRRALESREQEQSQEKGYKIYDDSDSSDSIEPDPKNDEWREMEEAYVLPPLDRTIHEAPAEVVTRPSRSSGVLDIENEHHYSLADGSKFTTPRASGQRESSNHGQSKSVPKGNNCIVPSTKMKISGGIIVCLIFVGIAAALLVFFIGNVSLFYLTIYVSIVI